jgi:hypothetical protein
MDQKQCFTAFESKVVCPKFENKIKICRVYLFLSTFSNNEYSLFWNLRRQNFWDRMKNGGGEGRWWEIARKYGKGEQTDGKTEETTDRQTDRQAGRERGRLADRQIDRLTYRKKDRWKDGQKNGQAGIEREAGWQIGRQTGREVGRHINRHTYR